MLFNVLLKAGEFVTLTRQGRFVNIVLAAGEIQGRFTMNGAKPLQTNLISGMAFEPGLFSEASFKSPITQQAKIWIGDTPLNYSPEIARAVGSNALKSFVGQVYSGQPYQLLDAEPGRNRITLTPESDIYIGGANLTPQNGVKISAGQTFSMSTQGAVYALEKSGNYPLYTYAKVTPDQVQKAKYLPESTLGGDKFAPDMRMGLYEVRAGEVWGRDSDTKLLSRYNRKTGERLESISLPTSAESNYDIMHKGKYCTGINNAWVSIGADLDVTVEDVPDFGEPTIMAANGEVRAMASWGTRKFAISTKPGEWFVTERQAWDLVEEENPNYMAIANDGTVYLCGNGSGVFRTKDGVSWERGDHNGSYGGAKALKGLAVLPDGRVFVINSQGLQMSSDGGETFVFREDLKNTALMNDAVSYPDPEMVVSDGETLIVVGIGYIAVLQDDDTWRVETYPDDSASVSPYECAFVGTGEFWIVLASSKGFVQVTGEQVPLNGLPVSIMAEVN